MMLLRKSKLQEASTLQGVSVTRVLAETTEEQITMPAGVPEGDKIVVTIARQCGSGGAEIGRFLSHKSGLHYLDHEIIDEVARRSGVTAEQIEGQDEQTTGPLAYVLDALNTSMPFNLNYSNILRPPSRNAPRRAYEQAYFYLTQRVVLEMACSGNTVIIGRGGQFLLRGLPRILHVYVFAPLPRRVANVMQHFHLTHARALEYIERRDSETENYLRHYYGSNGTQPELYHLLINTGLFSFEAAANLIIQALPLARELK
ncbi:MAG TPA: cytidylate kinase-like family protein [Ktedonobacteraceae bacterium]|nr:cytidylate kinase-like family protein [Ktedonobacteraceae bacterium]